MKTIAAMLVFASAVFAQDAKIMILERQDTKTLSDAYRDYKAAQKKWEEVKDQVSKKYSYEAGKPMPGWEKIQFSADFRAMVPESSPYASRSSCMWSGLTTTTSSAIPAWDSTSHELTGISSGGVGTVHWSGNADTELYVDHSDGVNQSLTTK